MVEGEWTRNEGSNGRIRIKGNQHIVAMNFDVSPIRGKLINHATLVCHQSAESISGVTISTIAAPWDERTSNGLTSGAQHFDGWGYSNARFPAICGGNAFTLVHQTESVVTDGAYHWEIPVDMVHALSTGVAYGLAIHEHDADYSRNPSIYSREQSGKQPYLLVDILEETDARPQQPTELKLLPVDAGSAKLNLRAPQNGFAYEVRVDGHSVARHNIPLVRAGEEQTILLRDLPETSSVSGLHEITVITINRTGEQTDPAVVRGRLFDFDSPVFPRVEIPENADQSVNGKADGVEPDVNRNVVDTGVIPVTDKYDQSGQPVSALPPDYRRHNWLFDGQRIHLTAAAGEVVSFQTLLRGSGDVRLQCEFDGSPMRVDMYKAIYVPVNGRMVPDPLMPLPEKIRLSQNTDQSLLVDVFVPFDSPAGTRRGMLRISDGRSVPIELTILPVQLPKRAAFHCEMNGYGMPDHVDDFYALQQVAYDHRVHANILHYSHHSAAPGVRKSNLDMRLRSGRRMDNQRYDAIAPRAQHAYWDDFVEAFGPYLNGTFFRNGHRGSIPAPGFYLTFHESWPLNCRTYFNGHPDAYRAFATTPEYAQTFVNIVDDFARLAHREGWDETGFQVYFNNKGSLTETTKAPWILDEPTSYWDYRALQFYGELTDSGRNPTQNESIRYRIDISRPEFCRGQLADRSDLWVVASAAFQNYRRLITDRMQQNATRVWVYGTTNPVDESNRQVQAWALDSWKSGATGIVPWQTIDKTGNALQKADQLGLFIFDKTASGETVVRHSMRLKAYRDAEQLIALLQLVQDRMQWNANQMAAFADHYVRLAGTVQKVNDADAGTSEYDSGSLIAIDALRQAAITLLR
ncbi:MAG: hypothetical protein KDA91_14660 [Planctomycetaceae bacterium]|nr:hypothetical protein [Planctomycetaceae bacterium]